eukprot:TRINITY_DN64064_c0_g1_i1.p1 TRINITY_DN64064_c0_g1~~TRINITY_DN64064_c0_g1_i1.p1  ORF type:complete len:611 (+),score=57.97 TRINITY_DN64064_c0_g1_i1:152-1984(+)
MKRSIQTAILLLCVFLVFVQQGSSIELEHGHQLRHRGIQEPIRVPISNPTPMPVATEKDPRSWMNPNPPAEPQYGWVSTTGASAAATTAVAASQVGVGEPQGGWAPYWEPAGLQPSIQPFPPADPPYVAAGKCMHDIQGGFHRAGVLMVFGMLFTTFVVYVLINGCFISRGEDEDGIQEAKRPHIQALDGLRPLVLSYVFLIHFPTGIPQALLPYIQAGWPMQFFFVLSGYIRHYSMGAKHQPFDLRTGSQWVGSRVLMLLPIYFLAMGLDYVRVASSGTCEHNACKPLIAWVMNSMFLQGFFPVRVCGSIENPSWNYMHFNGNGVGWFTADLVWCCCCFPAIRNIMLRYCGNFQKTLSLMFSVFVLRVALEASQPEWGKWGEGILHLYAFAPVRVLEYALGCLAALACSQAPQGVRDAWGSLAAFDFLVIAAPFAAATSLFYFDQNCDYSGDFYLLPLWCLICASAELTMDREAEDYPQKDKRVGPIYSILRSWLGTFLAPYGFAFYMSHQVVMRVLWTGGHGRINPHIFQFPGSLIFAWLCAAGINQVFEAPAQKSLQVLLSPARERRYSSSRDAMQYKVSGEVPEDPFGEQRAIGRGYYSRRETAAA